jgi:hypothetical protein
VLLLLIAQKQSSGCPSWWQCWNICASSNDLVGAIALWLSNHVSQFEKIVKSSVYTLSRLSNEPRILTFDVLYDREEDWQMIFFSKNFSDSMRMSKTWMMPPIFWSGRTNKGALRNLRGMSLFLINPLTRAEANL